MALGHWLAVHDVLVLWDTRGNPAVLEYLDQYETWNMPVAERTNGSGCVIAVHKRIADFTQIMGQHDTIPLVWLRIHGMYVGMVYARWQLVSTARLQAEFITTLQVAVMAQQALGPVMLVGDFNAHIGTLADCLGQPPRAQGNHNQHGNALMEAMRRCQMLTATGRLDGAAPSFFKGGNSSRIDHVFIQQDLQSHVHSARLQPVVRYVDFVTDADGNNAGPLDTDVGHHTCLSDHSTLHVQFSVPEVTAGRLPPRPPYIRWDAEKQLAWAAAVLNMQDSPMWADLAAAVEAGQLDMAVALLNSVLWAAATTVGLVVDPARAPCGPKPVRLPLEAQQIKRDMRRARREGRQISTDLRDKWRQCMFNVRCERRQATRIRMRRYLYGRPRSFWKKYAPKQTQLALGVSIDSWREWYLGKFGQTQDTTSGGTAAGGGGNAADDAAAGGTGGGSGAQHNHVPGVAYVLGVPVRAPLPEGENPSTMCAGFELDELVAAFQKVGTAKASGVDGMPAELLTRAAIRGEDGEVNHLFAHVLLGMFNHIVRTGHMPRAWAAKRIHPIHKAGPKDQPGNYRPLAVATAAYRLFTAILSARLTALVTETPGMLTDQQFGFRKAFSVEHNHFVILTARDIAFKRRKPLVMLKLDISKAYDTVHRDTLWRTMLDAGIPADFTSLMQCIYAGTEYVVLANGMTAQPFPSRVGLLQGCALSPMLYNIYLKPCLQDIHEQCVAAGIHVQVAQQQCTALNYADDVQVLLHSKAHVACFMQIANAALAKQHQHLNVDKCKVLTLQRSRGNALAEAQVAGLAASALEMVLGLQYQTNGSFAPNVGVRKAKGLAKARCILGRLRRCGCHHDAEVACTVLKGDLLPTLLFGSNLWGCYDLVADPMNHTLQGPYSMLMRRVLGVPESCSHWTASLMFGQLPVQYHIIRYFSRFWNRLLSTARSNPLVQACLDAQHNMMMSGTTCWLKQWHDRLAVATPPGASMHMQESLRDLEPMDVGLVCRGVQQTYQQAMVDCGDPAQPACPHRRIATVFRGFCASGQVGRKPAWMHLDWASLPDRVWTDWTRFASTFAKLPAHKFADMHKPFAQRVCTECTLGEPGNEEHVLFRCSATERVRQEYATKLAWPQDSSMNTFVARNAYTTDLPLFVSKLLRTYHQTDH